MQDPETGATRQYIVTQMCDSTSKSLTERINILDLNLSKNPSVNLSTERSTNEPSGRLTTLT